MREREGDGLTDPGMPGSVRSGYRTGVPAGGPGGRQMRTRAAGLPVPVAMTPRPFQSAVAPAPVMLS
ncbi:hypothetical protein GCM10010249_14560 [Streptomyces roseolilacinus]|uniref:Uncharacterized protein n=1 Tax=Streptomyces roseolilacinus TaxID=66904 RepID=A0A918AX85_9ACTN|nr:hypothetical protein GCM10010249_14560 [Streptomyces roseolilacinus]